ncbi:hypothetical protein KP509_04G055800 [Ceratopteris richardii]|uniref:Uncharacterized protein n=1 Tax=Ceratopteris richardii TaxID=49495 RepID=A0A8T2V4Y8_CERRI|nr:hypothetical protein KP509_04G055800 [Ceratopteris richardii]KAH7439320.1 hypothetical protein KP509_04G055800 [Ceratopteris richardii]
MDDGKSTRKRKRTTDISVDLTNTKFGQLRRALQELRPYVLDLLRSPDFQNNRSSPLVRKGINQVRNICKELRQETMVLAKQKRPADASIVGKEDHEEPGVKKQAKLVNDAPIFVDDPGPSLVGCAPAGWNFILVRSFSEP